MLNKGSYINCGIIALITRLACISFTFISVEIVMATTCTTITLFSVPNKAISNVSSMIYFMGPFLSNNSTDGGSKLTPPIILFILNFNHKLSGEVSHITSFYQFFFQIYIFINIFVKIIY
jgi:hypothetical protein